MHPILIDFGFWRLSTYGTLVAAGYLIGILWLKSQMKPMGLDEDKFWALIYALFLGAIAGGKLLYVALEWRAFWSGQAGFFRDFRYGFVFFGGFLGAIAAGFFAARRIGISFWAAADYCGAALPLGHAVGRLGCLAAGCCYGKPTTLPWGVRLGGSPWSVTPEYLWGIPLHPTQLYESFANVLIFVFLIAYALPRVKRKEWLPGTVFLAYAILYSFARFVIEFYRGDDRGGFLWTLSVSQWIALLAFLAAGGLMAKRGVSVRKA